MELPVTHPRCRRRCGTAGRGGRRRQALGGHSAVRLRTRPRLGTDRCTTGVPLCHRSGCNGRSGGGHRGHGAVHRLHQDRTGHRRAGGRTIDSLRRRTGRQGPGHRPGRRRSFARRQRDRLGGTVQLGSGLHLRGAGLRRGTGLCPVCRTAHRAGPVDQAGGRQRFVLGGCRRVGHRAAGRNRARAMSRMPWPTGPRSRPAERRPAGSSSPRFFSTWIIRWRACATRRSARRSR